MVRESITEFYERIQVERDPDRFQREVIGEFLRLEDHISELLEALAKAGAAIGSTRSGAEVGPEIRFEVDGVSVRARTVGSGAESHAMVSLDDFSGTFYPKLRSGGTWGWYPNKELSGKALSSEDLARILVGWAITSEPQSSA